MGEAPLRVVTMRARNSERGVRVNLWPAGGLPGRFTLRRELVVAGFCTRARVAFCCASWWWPASALEPVSLSVVQASGAISVHAQLVRVHIDISPGLPIRARAGAQGARRVAPNPLHRKVDAALIPTPSPRTRFPQFGT